MRMGQHPASASTVWSWLLTPEYTWRSDGCLGRSRRSSRLRADTRAHSRSSSGPGRPGYRIRSVRSTCERRKGMSVCHECRPFGNTSRTVWKESDKPRLRMMYMGSSEMTLCEMPTSASGPICIMTEPMQAYQLDCKNRLGRHWSKRLTAAAGIVQVGLPFCG